MTTETRYTTGTIWNEEDTKAFRKWLTGVLWHQVATVVFTKADGTERTMRCTLNPALMPPEEPKQVTEAKTPSPRKHNPDVRTAYDVDANSWRSFRWTSIKSVTVDII